MSEPLDTLDKSYKEVLDATKHQDDKVGRFLTAFAFFAGGAIALLNQDFMKVTAYAISPFGALRLPAILLATFLVLLGFTVLALLMSVGTPLKLPGGGSSSDHSSNRSKSPIYFLAISKVTSEEWIAQFKDLDDEAAKNWMRDSLLNETHNLATRTYQKYDRYQEARAIFELAIVVFTLAVATAVPAFTRPASATSTVTWDGPVRVFVGAVFGLLVGVIGYDRYRGDSSVRILRSGDNSVLTRQRVEMGLVVSAVLWTFLAVLLSTSGLVAHLMALLIASLPWALALFSIRPQIGEERTKQQTKQWILLAVSSGAIGVGTLLIAMVPHAETTAWRLLLSVVPLLALELDQVSKPTRSWRSLKKGVQIRLSQNISLEQSSEAPTR